MRETFALVRETFEYADVAYRGLEGRLPFSKVLGFVPSRTQICPAGVWNAGWRTRRFCDALPCFALRCVALPCFAVLCCALFVRCAALDSEAAVRCLALLWVTECGLAFCDLFLKRFEEDFFHYVVAFEVGVDSVF